MSISRHRDSRQVALTRGGEFAEEGGTYHGSTYHGGAVLPCSAEEGAEGFVLGVRGVSGGVPGGGGEVAGGGSECGVPGGELSAWAAVRGGLRGGQLAVTWRSRRLAAIERAGRTSGRGASSLADGWDVLSWLVR